MLLLSLRSLLRLRHTSSMRALNSLSSRSVHENSRMSLNRFAQGRLRTSSSVHHSGVGAPSAAQRTRSLAAARAAGGNTDGASGPWSSNAQSELVTRTLLGSAGALCRAGVPPGAVAAAFSTAAG